MKRFRDQIPNYDKQPFLKISDPAAVCWESWETMASELDSAMKKLGRTGTIVLEHYQGVDIEEYKRKLISLAQFDKVIDAGRAFKTEQQIHDLIYPDVTDDRIFGYLTRLHLEDFFDVQKLENLREEIAGQKGLVFVVGIGASLLVNRPGILVYADMARWEIQQRQRKNLVNNLGASNHEDSATATYKRSFFVDWRVLDRHKKTLFEAWDYVIDANGDVPKMMKGDVYNAALLQATQQPFRLVPFFDPGPWGGQWMREVCDLDKEPVNYAWCFDCVPEENSLLLKIGDTFFETPSINLVFQQPLALLGESVYGRFGDEFPIRFDFLDTMEGGNLSLQVHPVTQYIQEHFGMHYTQDESYYLLDAKPGSASVYLGTKNGIEPDDLIQDLEKAQSEGGDFDADKYISKWPAKKHDHFLIPAGTIHCSGSEAMVLEISATPYIFTFKLWDWGRLGLDGKPRPINIKHGAKNIQWDRDADWTRDNLINKLELMSDGPGWREERTGLHETEFIETRRHWFTEVVLHETDGSVNVLNLVEGQEAIVESPDNNFDPFIVHYAETFVIPEAVKQYTIRPYGKSEGQECATLKAFIRKNY